MATNSDQNSLRLQYQILQEKQQQRLLRLQQRKTNESITASQEETNKRQSNDKNSNQINGQLSWMPEENLNLKLEVTDEENDDDRTVESTNDDEIAELKEIIRELKDENSRFRKLVREKDGELNVLRKNLENSKYALAGRGAGSDTAASRIVELSKKNRELSSQIGIEKTQSKELARKFAELNRELDQLKKVNLDFPNDFKNKNDGDNENTQEELEVTKEKLARTSTKLNEYRSQCQSQKQELKTMHKILIGELGDNVNINNLLNRSSNWRGRQQQIISLQDKVTDLKQQIAEMNKNGTIGRRSGATSIAINAFPVGIDAKHQSTIKKIEKQRKENQEKATIELEKLEESYKQMQQKYEGVRARNKILSEELKGTKAQMGTLLEKGKHDDEFIEVLLKENNNLKEHKTSESKIRGKELEDLHQLTSQLKAKCHNKDERIKALESTIEKLRRNSDQPDNNPKPISGKMRTFSSSSNNSDIPSGILPTPPPPRPRSDSINSEHSRPDSRLYSPKSNQSQGRSKLPVSAGTRKDTSNLYMQLQEHKALAQTTSIERDRLTELVKILQDRINELTNKNIEIGNQFQDQRRQNALLEKELDKTRRLNQQQGLKSSDTRKKAQRQSSTTDFETKIEELNSKLEIQRDENTALRETIRSISKGKDEDLKLYHQMMEQTKKIFLTSLREYKKLTA
ncbi:Coiled-coil domain-containing protein 13 [Trichoplax sp. H2]|nr:Coiled-coil domain-containing protein 13 [Trichoplax sp. H2]|eukprot:RDD37301.1 Coiled-coil domain-containing protein 13 [Trichoplax sp. H2]